MKKNLVFALLLVTGIANGQFFKTIGVKAGLCLANQTWEYKSINTEIKHKYGSGANITFTADILDKKYVSVSTDLGFVQKGFIQEIQINSTDLPDQQYTGIQQYKCRYNYLTFSPNVKVKAVFGTYTPYITIGPRIDYQVGYTNEFKPSRPAADFESVVFGVNYGIGLQYNKEQYGFLLEVQQQKDLSNILDTPTTATNTGMRIYNNAFTINLGFKYRLPATKSQQ